MYLIEAREEFQRYGMAGSPWAYRYDCFLGFVVRAENEQQAREFAAEKSDGAGDEGKEAWLDAKYSTCTILTTDGEPGVLLSDYNAG